MRLVRIGRDTWIPADRLTELEFRPYDEAQLAQAATRGGRERGHWMVSYTGASGCGCWQGIDDDLAHGLLAEFAGPTALTDHLRRWG